MTIKKLIKTSIVSLALLVLPIVVSAQTPQLPHIFYGELTINSAPAPIGTVVIAKVDGVEKGRITTTVTGKYGGPGAYDQKLLVQGSIADNATVIFLVNDHNAEQTASFHSGTVQELNLAVNFEIPPVAQPPSGGGGGGGSGGSGNGGGNAIWKVGDANHDGRVDILDFNILMVNWGSLNTNNIADFSLDGRVDILDFNLLMVNWGL